MFSTYDVDHGGYWLVEKSYNLKISVKLLKNHNSTKNVL